MRPSNSQVAQNNKTELLEVYDFHKLMDKNQYKSQELIAYFNKFNPEQQLDIINYFYNPQFYYYIRVNCCHEFMILIGNKIMKICNADDSKMYLLDILITRIIPLLNNENQNELIIQNNFLDSFGPEYISRLFDSIAAKRNKPLYNHILSYKKFITGNDGKSYLKYSGKTLYLQKRCDSKSSNMSSEELLNFIMSFFTSLDGTVKLFTHEERKLMAGLF